MSGLEGSAPGEVPRASRLQLFDAVAEYNVPFLDKDVATHPIPKLRALMKQEHGPIFSWMASVHRNLNAGFGGDEELLTPEAAAFDNAAIIAYGLIRVGYDKAGVPLPGAKQPPE